MSSAWIPFSGVKSSFFSSATGFRRLPALGRSLGRHVLHRVPVVQAQQDEPRQTQQAQPGPEQLLPMLSHGRHSAIRTWSPGCRGTAEVVITKSAVLSSPATAVWVSSDASTSTLVLATEYRLPRGLGLTTTV